MYVPKHFEQGDVDAMHRLIAAHPLGALVVATDEGLEANHVPLLCDPGPAPYGTLRGHIARANPLWRAGLKDPTALVIFQGPEGFVSPSWYATKVESAKVVPTWNYAVVHARGRLRFAHSDLAGYSVFEEAFTAGCEVAEPLAPRA
jgi:transcriptional regulator